jgi:O-methyltransferase
MDLCSRYLSFLKKSLNNDLYLENEARIIYFLRCLLEQKPIEVEAFLNIRSHQIAKDLSAAREGGGWYMIVTQGDDGRVVQRFDLRFVTETSHLMMGRVRLNHLHQCLETVVREAIPGDFIETGVWKGGGTIFMRGFLAAHGIADRNVWVADSFEGIPPPSLAQDQGYDMSKAVQPHTAVSLEDVMALFERYDLLDDQVRFLKGWFADTLPTAPIERLAIMRLDGDLYESTRDALSALYDRLSPGGFVIIDDFVSLPPCEEAVLEFRSQRNITAELLPIDGTAMFWRKPLT